MWSASLYIIVCSARNRLRTRLARMREPRYVLGALAGAAYLYFSVFARLWGSQQASRRRRRAARGPVLALSSMRSAAPAALGVGLLAVSALSWLVPVDSGLLDFSDAESAFLFPAPVSRRALLVYRMMRSQVGLLFGAIILGLATPSIGGFARLRIGVAMWLLLFIGKVYFTGVTLVRVGRTATSGSVRRRAWLPIGAIAAAVVIVGTALARAFAGGPVSGVEDALIRLSAATSSGLPAVVLWPFTAVTRPFAAEWPGPYLRSLASAVAVLIATVAWVLKSDESVQDAAAHVAHKRAAVKRRQASSLRARATGLPLALTGRPEIAFAWKAALQTMRVVDRRSLARLAAVVVSLSAVAVSTNAARGIAVMLGTFAVAGVGFAIVMAPQALRIDMRQDLQHLELLKTWPVTASAIVRGEMLWPGALVTVVAWALLGLALFLSAGVFARTSLELRVVVAASVAALAPALIFAQLAIHNGIALMFPAWVPLGNQRARGLDAMGQRLILLGGTMLVLLVMVLPGGVAGAIVLFVFRPLVAIGALAPAAVACAAVIGVEVLLITEVLGPVYERLDITAVEHAE
ncbi:MAG TPA: hypothetical protein VG222_06370 [Vicinamibacterales bacterium]|nr:hypothetical protein [Vicinamibacterales bacterium]